MTALIAVEGGRVGSDVDAFSCAPVVPITFSGHYFNVTGPKVMVFVRCVLHDGRFVNTRCGLSRGEMLFVSG